VELQAMLIVLHDVDVGIRVIMKRRSQH
jgi:hypothetical protein